MGLAGSVQARQASCITPMNLKSRRNHKAESISSDCRPAAPGAASRHCRSGHHPPSRDATGCAPRWHACFSKGNWRSQNSKQPRQQAFIPQGQPWHFSGHICRRQSKEPQPSWPHWAQLGLGAARSDWRPSKSRIQSRNWGRRMQDECSVEKGAGGTGTGQLAGGAASRKLCLPPCNEAEEAVQGADAWKGAAFECEVEAPACMPTRCTDSAAAEA